jgi:hypothetical protein
MGVKQQRQCGVLIRMGQFDSVFGEWRDKSAPRLGHDGEAQRGVRAHVLNAVECASFALAAVETLELGPGLVVCPREIGQVNPRLLGVFHDVLALWVERKVPLAMNRHV